MNPRDEYFDDLEEAIHQQSLGNNKPMREFEELDALADEVIKWGYEAFCQEENEL